MNSKINHLLIVYLHVLLWPSWWHKQGRIALVNGDDALACPVSNDYEDWTPTGRAINNKCYFIPKDGPHEGKYDYAQAIRRCQDSGGELYWPDNVHHHRAVHALVKDTLNAHQHEHRRVFLHIDKISTRITDQKKIKQLWKIKGTYEINANDFPDTTQGSEQKYTTLHALKMKKESCPSPFTPTDATYVGNIFKRRCIVARNTNGKNFQQAMADCRGAANLNGPVRPTLIDLTDNAGIGLGEWIKQYAGTSEFWVGGYVGAITQGLCPVWVPHAEHGGPH